VLRRMRANTGLSGEVAKDDYWQGQHQAVKSALFGEASLSEDQAALLTAIVTVLRTHKALSDLFANAQDPAILAEHMHSSVAPSRGLQAKRRRRKNAPRKVRRTHDASTQLSRRNELHGAYWRR
jgi:hypothetical protein